MKNFITVGFALLVMSTVASAQGPGERLRRQRAAHEFRERPPLSLRERMQLKKNYIRYRIAQRRAKGDGVITPLEKRRLYQIRKQNRHQYYRFRHNDRRLA
ncbi:MAG TPA: hypothetical protein VEB63_04790 [Chitinophagaceae bacterium]|nr:hypothetical protein [Chitinophagaceae bacterium]